MAIVSIRHKHMKIAKDTDLRFANIEKKVGIFILVACFGIIAVFVFMGIQKDIFSYKKRIYFVTDSGKDINAGQTVTLCGFKIGKVKKLLLDEFARVKVELSVSSKYMQWITTDSRARLVKEFPMGASVIEITPGSAGAGQVKENNILLFEREKWLTDIATTIKKIDILVDSLSQTVAVSNATLGRLNKDIPHILHETKISAKSLRRKMPHIFYQTNKGLKEMQDVAKDMKEITQKMTPQIQAIIEKGNTVTNDAKEIADAVKKIWPIRSYIKKSKEMPVKNGDYDINH